VGHNPSTSLLAAATKVADAKARGAKLVVIDPRRIGFAVKADCWLRVRPGTDAAIALAIAGVMLDQGWFDTEFMRNWTNGPFLIRDDDSTMLRSEILVAQGDTSGFVAWDEGRGACVTYEIGKRRYCETLGRLAISGEFVVDTREGPIRCRPAFELFAARVPFNVPRRGCGGFGSGARGHPGSGVAALASSACCPIHLDRS
jgi:anaerobic selenocysteine-containing dehydrogenase